MGFNVVEKSKRRKTWDIKMVAEADTTEVRERCTRQLVQNAIKNAKFLLSPAAIVQYIAKIALQSAKEKGARSKPLRLADEFSKLLGLKKQLLQKAAKIGLLGEQVFLY